jgi:hypothetical protein
MYMPEPARIDAVYAVDFAVYEAPDKAADREDRPSCSIRRTPWRTSRWLG